MPKLPARITVTLSTFTVLVLQHRAKEQRISASAAIEAAILENITVHEVERLMKQSPDFARVALEWMSSAGKKRRT
ncbi:MAG: hypothetical protein QOC81_1327 [Thermoanaerobaculia bacterium]|jgi:hypothetical protein|nr:hypothetical protein [Thermoanaerobaculia bacterium]